MPTNIRIQTSESQSDLVELAVSLPIEPVEDMLNKFAEDGIIQSFVVDEVGAVDSYCNPVEVKQNLFNKIVEAKKYFESLRNIK